MATNIIMPALEMAQESGTLVSWLKQAGQAVAKGEPIMEIETDKVTIEIEAPASGILGGILVREGEVVPVGQTIAWILAPGESPPAAAALNQPTGRTGGNHNAPIPPPVAAQPVSVEASPLARNIASEQGLDLALVKPAGKRIEKADVMAYLQEARGPGTGSANLTSSVRLSPASPKARRLAAERGLELSSISGSGPLGAVLAVDLPPQTVPAAPSNLETPATLWRVMAEHMTDSWSSVPHFYLMREVDASQLIEWRSHVRQAVEKLNGTKLTFTDLLVKTVGFALRSHPRLNAAWADGRIQLNQSINVGIATATDEGLIVPVIRNADQASLGEIAARRSTLTKLAQERKLRPADISGGTFTITNLGMYRVDAFNAIVNTPQAAILAVGRIAERVVPVDGKAVVRPMLVLTLSCDHRVVDGARAAQFLDELANLIEDPWRLLI
jgi:pyruvate dehydrogenase E2 component (dihydrolipoamide acetyltransferase)